MANPKPTPRIENLKPKKKGEVSHEEAVEKGRKGGKKSGQARREKKLISQIWAEFLINKHRLELEKGKPETMTGHEAVNRVGAKVLEKGGAPAVSLFKEIREATEGNLIRVESDFTEQIDKLKSIVNDRKRTD